MPPQTRKLISAFPISATFARYTLHTSLEDPHSLLRQAYELLGSVRKVLP
jgi:hypothetical protein